ncbi:DoxX family protein [Bradyrhizobium sp. USDA 4520]
MSVTKIHAAPRWQPIALWTVKIVLALAFIAASSAKLFGAPTLVNDFEIIGLGQWFRYVTAALEVIGAILILIPALSAFGGLLLCCIMVGAMLAHLLILPGSIVPAIVLFVLTGIVVFAERRRRDVLFRTTNR